MFIKNKVKSLFFGFLLLLSMPSYSMSAPRTFLNFHPSTRNTSIAILLITTLSSIFLRQLFIKLNQTPVSQTPVQKKVPKKNVQKYTRKKKKEKKYIKRQQLSLSIGKIIRELQISNESLSPFLNDKTFIKQLSYITITAAQLGHKLMSEIFAAEGHPENKIQLLNLLFALKTVIDDEIRNYAQMLAE